jgi:predicted ester cyclase
VSSGPSKELALSEIDRLGDLWERAWAGGGRDALALCCTVDLRYEDPLSVGALEGVDALDQHITAMRQALPDMRIERTAARIAEGSFGCLPFRIVGTHRGKLGELPPTNRFVTMHGLHYVELRDDLISRGRGFFDLYDAAQQLGLLPRRGSLAESALMMLRGFGLRSRS